MKCRGTGSEMSGLMVNDEEFLPEASVLVSLVICVFMGALSKKNNNITTNKTKHGYSLFGFSVSEMIMGWGGAVRLFWLTLKILRYFNLNNNFKKTRQQLLSMMPVFSLLESHVSTSEFAGLSYTYAF